jgi:enterochelin esterase-like enzyme
MVSGCSQAGDHREEYVVLEPQGTLFLILLLLAFGGLITWVALAGQVVFRVIAACLAFIPAMVFGIFAVNKYYDYYQTWGALYNDLSGQTTSIPHLTAAGLGKGTAGSLKSLIGTANDSQIDEQYGLLFSAVIAGHHTHISRTAYVYLPPQYFQKAYANYKFPAIELLHGSPGDPSAWVNVMNVVPIYLSAMESGKAKPAVLVMPNTDGGQQYGLQCLNDPGGVQDMTYVAEEVPDWAVANLRVQPVGAAWGVAGYSEGAYCAANIALQHPNLFGYAGSLSGYFSPVESQVPLGGKAGGTPVDVNDFAHSKKLLLINSPDEYITRVPVSVSVPQFFLAAGATDVGDVQAAQLFRQELLLRDADVPLEVVPGGGHQATVWRAALTPMLDWMTPQLAGQVAYAEWRAKQVKLHAEHKPPVKHHVVTKKPSSLT